MDFLIDSAFLTAFLSSVVRLATPIAFATLGGVVAERSGVYNVGLEGMMLIGAFAAAAGSFLSGSPLIGLGTGMFAGAIAGLLLAILSVKFRVNQLVAGIAVNLLCAGLTAFLARAIFTPDEGGNHSVSGFGVVHFSLLSDVPIIGPALFSQDPLVYLLIILTIVTSYIMFRTQAGLRLRATGENPKAADTAGVNVMLVRYVALAFSGALAALGGSHLVLSQVYVFSEGMSAGRGFIALAAIILGRWHPVWGVAAALFFGFCDAMQLRLQFSHPDIPYQLFLILPFAASLIVLIWLPGSVRQPEATGKIFDRETR